MTAVLILFGASLVLVIYFALTSDRGWQDKHGFHYGDPDRSELPPDAPDE